QALEFCPTPAKAGQLKAGCVELVAARQKLDAVHRLNIGINLDRTARGSLVEESPELKPAARAEKDVSETRGAPMVRFDVVLAVAGFAGRQGYDEREPVGGAGLRRVVLVVDRRRSAVAIREPDAHGISGSCAHHLPHFAR